MKNLFLLLTITTISLSACGGSPIPLGDTPEPAKNSPTPTVQTAISTPTLTPVGTWEAVIYGVIYDKSTGPEVPIAGATIIYDVLQTYYPELQESRSNQTASDEGGMFSLTVMVHNIDSVRVVIQAKGYTTVEENMLGSTCFLGKA